MDEKVTASSAPLILATIVNSFVALCEVSNCASTALVSAICGMALGDTKEPQSKISKPTFKSCCR